MLKLKFLKDTYLAVGDTACCTLRHDRFRKSAFENGQCDCTPPRQNRARRGRAIRPEVTSSNGLHTFEP
jgi:hypothetical protein